jgi:hypothetical protein
VLEHPGAWLPAEPANLYHADLPRSEPPCRVLFRTMPGRIANSPPCRGDGGWLLECSLSADALRKQETWHGPQD